MSTIQELRNRVMGMTETDCRQELADTLGKLDQLEADFETVIVEVANLSFNDVTETYDTSKRFDSMVKIRGIELP